MELFYQVFAYQVTPSNLIEWVSKYRQKHVLKNKIRLNYSETDDFDVRISKFKLDQNLSLFYLCEFDRKAPILFKFSISDATNFLAGSASEWWSEQMAEEK